MDEEVQAAAEVLDDPPTTEPTSPPESQPLVSSPPPASAVPPPEPAVEPPRASPPPEPEPEPDVPPNPNHEQAGRDGFVHATAVAVGAMLAWWLLRKLDSNVSRSRQRSPNSSAPSRAGDPEGWSTQS